MQKKKQKSSVEEDKIREKIRIEKEKFLKRIKAN
jgi:hypothetical protein